MVAFSTGVQAGMGHVLGLSVAAVLYKEYSD